MCASRQPTMFSNTSDQVFNHSNMVNAGGHHITLNLSVGTPQTLKANDAAAAVSRVLSDQHQVEAHLGVEPVSIDPWRPPPEPVYNGYTRIVPKPLVEPDDAPWRDTDLPPAIDGPLTPPETERTPSMTPHRGAPGKRKLCPDMDDQAIEEGPPKKVASIKADKPATISVGIDILDPDRLSRDMRRFPECGVEILNYSTVYERNMYSKGHGYPCANPQPYGAPVKIGDVGILGNDGFQTVCNIYTLPAESGLAESVPEASTIYQSGKFREGDNITAGVASVSVNYDELDFVANLQFHCTSLEGAILAMTSSADLEALKDNFPLRNYLCNNAKHVYDFVQKIRQLDPEESLYIVTGQIKTDSWAMATYSKPMQEPHNVLVLKRRQRTLPKDPAPPYVWTQTCNAEARRGCSTSFDDDGQKIKDQCLFLRGFLLTSKSILQSGISQNRKPHSQDKERPDHEGPRDGGGGSTSLLGARGSSQSSTSYNSSINISNSSALTDGQECEVDAISESYPGHGQRSLYPSQCMNMMLLDETAAEFAVTHDDDWRHILEDQPWNDDEISRFLVDLKEKGTPAIRDGVATLNVEHVPSEPSPEFKRSPSTLQSTRFGLGSSHLQEVRITGGSFSERIPTPSAFPQSIYPRNERAASTRRASPILL